jgi:hypothetical protein
MAHLTSFLAAGLAGVLMWDVYVAPRALDTGSAGSNVFASGDTAAAVRSGDAPVTTVNRSRKGDRLVGSQSSRDAHPTIAKVEFGPGDTVLLRNGAGDTLFAVDPVAQRTVIAKNVTLPQLTVQSSARKAPDAPAAPQPAADQEPAVNPEALRNTTIGIGRKPEAKRPTGCDPAFSPIASPQLGHIFGRCVTSIEAPTRLALAQ